MTTVGEIAALLREKAPVEKKMDFDNVGLLVGSAGHAVSRVLVALDITDEVIDEAVSVGAELIVSHHPLFFSLASVIDDTPEGARAYKLVRNDIAAICMHTNLDAAQGGVNDALMQALGGRVLDTLDPATGIGRIGEIAAPMAFPDFLPFVKKTLSAFGLRYHDAGRSVKRLAVCGGSGGGDIPLAAAAGCDTYVTADVKYHQFQQAKDLGLNLIDADHFCTENVVTPVLRDWIAAAFPQLDVGVSQRLGQLVRFC